MKPANRVSIRKVKPMTHVKAFNLLLVMLVALWLPTSPCCAMASSALAGDATDAPTSDTQPPAHCPAPSPCDSHTPEPAQHDQPGQPHTKPADHANPCGSHDACDCFPALTPSCGRGASTPAALTTTLPTLFAAPTASPLPDLYPPTFPTGRLGIDLGRPTPIGAPTLLQLGCMLTT